MDPATTLRSSFQDNDLDALENQFRGKQFRELVQAQMKKMGRRLPEALAAHLAALTDLEKALGAEIIDKLNALAFDADFWRRDLADVLHQVRGDFRVGCRNSGIEPKSEAAFCLFQVIVLNFTDLARQQRGLRRFAGIRTGLVG